MHWTSKGGPIAMIMAALLLAALNSLNGCGGASGGPPPPSNFLLTAPANTTSVGVGQRPTLTWEDADGETGYMVQISTSPTFTTNTFTWTLSANTTSAIVTWPSVTTGNQYYWQVLATNNGGTTRAANAPFTFTP